MLKQNIFCNIFCSKYHFIKFFRLWIIFYKTSKTSLHIKLVNFLSICRENKTNIENFCILFCLFKSLCRLFAIFFCFNNSQLYSFIRKNIICFFPFSSFVSRKFSPICKIKFTNYLFFLPSISLQLRIYKFMSRVSFRKVHLIKLKKYFL